jgi:DNA repair exonuclease SbcCD nuclease subunit
MKTCIVGDTHFGIRNDSPYFLEQYIAWFKKRILIWKQSQLDQMVHVGDFFDRRKYVNYATLNKVRRHVLDSLDNLGIPIHIIAGNHDLYWRNESSVSSLNELIDGRYKNIRVHTKPYELGNILLMPWMNREDSVRVSDRTSGIVGVRGRSRYRIRNGDERLCFF